MNRLVAILLGVAVTIGATALWHGPLGTADAFRVRAESTARTILDNYEMTAVRAELQEAPLTRTLVLSGPADDFQRRELLRIMSREPGVARVRWQDMPGGGGLPLLAEAELYALAGFGLGLLLSYLLERRRRARSEWRW